LVKEGNFKEFNKKADIPFVSDIDKEREILNTAASSKNFDSECQNDIAIDNCFKSNIEQEVDNPKSCNLVEIDQKVMENEKILQKKIENSEVPCFKYKEDINVGRDIPEFHEKKEISKTSIELKNQLDEKRDMEEDKTKTQELKTLDEAELDSKISNGDASPIAIKIDEKYENHFDKIHIEKNTFPSINILKSRSQDTQDSQDSKISDNTINIDSVDIKNENEETMIKIKTDRVEILEDSEFKCEENKIDPEMSIRISKGNHQINISEITYNICNKSMISNSLNTSYTNNSNTNEEIMSKASPLILPKKESKNLKIKTFDSIKLLKKCKEKYKKKLSIYEKIDSNYHFMTINKLPLSMIETANTTPDIKSETANNKKGNPFIQKKKVLIKGYFLNKFKTFDHSLSQNSLANFKLLNIQDLHQNTKKVKFENFQNFI